MSKGRSPRARRPSSWWLVLGWICALLAAASAVAAIVLQRIETRPIGEGEVFVEDATTAAGLITAGPEPELGVRRARNTLGVESVSLVDAGGIVLASTSEPLVGEPVTNQLIASGASDQRLTALATAVESDIWLDEVVSWPEGSVLYQVISPIEGTTQSVLLHYDIGALLSRRTPPGQIQPSTLQLLALSTIFAVFGVAVLIGHARAARRYRSVARESELLRRHSEELQSANQSLEQARRQAEDALALAEEKIRIRSEFVLMINHELRTPLTSVVTGAELLRSTQLSAADRGAVLDSMIADGARLQEIIDQILAVARIENRGLSYELAGVSLEEVCNVVASAHPSVTMPDRHQHPDLTVETDLGALSMVIASLVDNAFTHGAGRVSVGCSSRPRIDPQVEVGERPSSSIYLTVEDDGPGIDPEFLPRVFEKFEKSSFSPGTGLGLYMARMIVEALEGSLAVNSSASGTTFQIAIPVVPASAPVGVAG